MKLYDFKMSPNAKRVRICLNEVGVVATCVEVDLFKGGNKSPEYLAKNPMGKVPTLEDDDGYVLWESPAQLVYLAAKHPDKGLLPKEPRSLAEATRWMFWNASHFEAAVFAIAFEKMIKPMMGGTTDTARVATAQLDIDRFAPVLNAQLEGRTWLLGSSYSIADITIGTTAEFATVAGIDLGRYPHLMAWLGRLQARDAWKRA